MPDILKRQRNRRFRRLFHPPLLGSSLNLLSVQQIIIWRAAPRPVDLSLELFLDEGSHFRRLIALDEGLHFRRLHIVRTCGNDDECVLSVAGLKVKACLLTSRPPETA